MHLLHKWIVIKEGKGSLTLQDPTYLTVWVKEAWTVIEQCSKCGKKKATATTLDGKKMKVNPNLIDL